MEISIYSNFHWLVLITFLDYFHESLRFRFSQTHSGGSVCAFLLLPPNRQVRGGGNTECTPSWIFLPSVCRGKKINQDCHDLVRCWISSTWLRQKQRLSCWKQSTEILALLEPLPEIHPDLPLSWGNTLHVTCSALFALCSWAWTCWLSQIKVI